MELTPTKIIKKKFEIRELLSIYKIILKNTKKDLFKKEYTNNRNSNNIEFLIMKINILELYKVII